MAKEKKKSSGRRVGFFGKYDAKKMEQSEAMM